MDTAEQILNSPEYQEANLATKRAIFVKHIAKSPDFANANAETQHAIIERFGIAEPEDVAQAPESESFSEVSEPSTVSTPEEEKSSIRQAQDMPPFEQAGAATGAVIGAKAGAIEKRAAKAAAADARSAGQKWKAKTGFGKGEGETVQEVSEAYKRAKNKGKVSSKILPGETLNINKWAEQQKLAEELAAKSKIAEGAQKFSKLLGKIPLGSTLMGAGAGLEGAEAYEAYKAGDYPLAAIHGLGALGSAATLIPTPATRLGGGALSLASIPAAELYKRMRNK